MGGRGSKSNFSSNLVTMKQWNDRYYFNGSSREMDDALGSKIFFDTKTNELVVQSEDKRGRYVFAKYFQRYSLDELDKFERSAIGSYERNKFQSISKLVKENFTKSRGIGSTSTSGTGK